MGPLRAAGDFLFRPGTFHACGDRNPVPDGVDCPRPEGHAPDRTEMSPNVRPWNVRPCPRRRRLSPFGRTRTRLHRNVPGRAAQFPTASADAAPKGAGEEQGGEGPRLLVLGRDDDVVVNRESHRSSNEAVLGGAVVERGGTLRIVDGSDGHCGVKGD